MFKIGTLNFVMVAMFTVLIIMNYTLSKTISLVFKQLNIDLRSLSKGDLTITPPAGFDERKDEIGDLVRSVIRLISSLKNIIGTN